MNITRKLTSSASVISIKGYYCRIMNNSSDSGYFCIGKDPVRGAEDTMEVKAGCSATICHCLKPIHAVGNGDFELFGFDNVSGFAGEDKVREYAEQESKKVLEEANSYTDMMSSNSNLLINPDFMINQTGSQMFSASGNTVDGWVMSIVGSGNSGSYNAETHILSGSVLDKNGYYVNMFQFVEEPMRFAGKIMTVSSGMSGLDKSALIQIWRTEGTTTTGVAATHYNLKADKVLTFTMPSDLTETSKIRVVLQTRGSVKLDWAKLEFGSAATRFVAPDPALELIKCQTYFQTTSLEVI